MNNAVSRISLDVHDVGSQVSVTARKMETGRRILATLMEKGRPYEIGYGCRAEFVMLRPDGTKLKNECTILDNAILYDLTERTTISTGVMQCEFRLTDASGDLLVSPKFRLEVYSTIYVPGDAIESEVANLNTVKSANPGYAEVFMWSDGNPDGQDRTGYFVGEDMDRAAAMVRICDRTSNVRGVAIKAPGFASNAPGERYTENNALRPQFCYVCLLGFAPVIDNGACAVNTRCCPGENGTAEPDDSGGGYLVVERLSENWVLILVEQAADMSLRVERLMDERLSQVKKTFTATIGTTWTGKEAPYTQAIAVAGMLETDEPKIWPLYSTDHATAVEQKEAWSMIDDADTGTGTITFRCLEEKPKSEIKIKIEVQRL